MRALVKDHVLFGDLLGQRLIVGWISDEILSYGHIHRDRFDKVDEVLGRQFHQQPGGVAEDSGGQLHGLSSCK